MVLGRIHGRNEYCYCLCGSYSSGKGGDVILEQAQKEEKTNPYNMPTGTAAPQTEAPATTETPATTAPAAEDSAN